MKYIENIVLKDSQADPFDLLSDGTIADWKSELEKTWYGCEEVFLPNILVTLNVFQSKSQIRKNRPDLWREIEAGKYEEIKVGKKKLFIVS